MNGQIPCQSSYQPRCRPQTTAPLKHDAWHTPALGSVLRDPPSPTRAIPRPLGPHPPPAFASALRTEVGSFSGLSLALGSARDFNGISGKASRCHTETKVTAPIRCKERPAGPCHRPGGPCLRGTGEPELRLGGEELEMAEPRPPPRPSKRSEGGEGAPRAGRGPLVGRRVPGEEGPGGRASVEGGGSPSARDLLGSRETAGSNVGKGKMSFQHLSPTLRQLIISLCAAVGRQGRRAQGPAESCQ